MDTLAARQQMVDQQIRTWEVLDPRVLDALSAVPREAFVPPSTASSLSPMRRYRSVSVRACSRPRFRGGSCRRSASTASDRALEVGTGTGYLSAA